MRSNYIRKEPNLDIDYASGAEIEYVSQRELGDGVLGRYLPSEHKILIAKDLPERERQFVAQHESAHAQGIIDEVKTDMHAASRTGYSLRDLGKGRRAA